MTPDQMTGNMERLVNSVGVAVAVLLVVLVAIGFAAWRICKWLAPLVEGVFKTHHDFVNSAKSQGEQILQLHEDNVQRQTNHASATDRTNTALRHGCDLLDMAIRGMPRETELRQHVLAIRNALSEP